MGSTNPTVGRPRKRKPGEKVTKLRTPTVPKPEDILGKSKVYKSQKPAAKKADQTTEGETQYEDKSNQPLGEPDILMLQGAEIGIWREVLSSVEEGYLLESDRFVMEMFCRLMNKYRTREPMTSKELDTMTSLMGKLGLSPIDRRRMNRGEDPKAKGKPKGNSFDGL